MQARTGCIIVIVIGLILGAVLWCSFTLAIQGELKTQNASLAGYRLWLIRDGEQSGIGFSRSRVITESSEAHDHCVETTSTFLILSPDPSQDQQTYCECYKRAENGWQFLGGCTL